MSYRLNPFTGNLDDVGPISYGSSGSGSATAGQIAFWTGTSSLSGESNLWWDAANDRVGIGTASPTAALDIRAVPASGVPVLGARSTADTTQATVEFYSHTGNAIFTLKQHPSTAASGIITNVTQINGLDSIGLSSGSGVGSSSAISINSGNFVVGYNSASTYGYLATRLAAGLSFQVNSIERLAISTAGNVLVNGFTSSTVGLTVKGAAAQSANLTEWQNSAGTVLSYITAAGIGTFGEAAGNDYGMVNITGSSTKQGLIVRPGSNSIALNIVNQASSANLLTVIDNVTTSETRINPTYTRLGAGNSGGINSSVSIMSGAAARIGLVVQGYASQTANLQEWQNSSGTALAAISAAGKLSFDSTVTAGGTTGAQTINKPSGTVNFAAAATSLVVTNSLVTTSSIVLCVVRTNDTTATIKNVVPASGSFTITLGAAATAETSVGFIVHN